MNAVTRPEPTLNGWIAIVLLPIVCVLPLLVELPRLWWVTGAVLACLLSDLLISWRRSPGVQGQWLLPRQAHAGTDVAIGVRARALGRRRPAVIWSWSPEAGRHLPMSVLPPAPPEHSSRCAWRVRFPERGRQHLPGIVLRQEAPLGLIARAYRLTADGELIVLPPLGRMRRSFRQQLERFVEEGRSSLHQGEEDVVRLRPYRPGDPPRDVQWKASARTRTLLVGVRGTPTTRHLALLLDLRSANAISPRLERLVAIAATVLDHCLQAGWVVTLHGGFAPTVGIGGDRLQLMRALALLQTDTDADSPEPEPPGGACLALGMHPSQHLRASPGVLAFDLDEAAELVHLPRLPRRRGAG